MLNPFVGYPSLLFSRIWTDLAKSTNQMEVSLNAPPENGLGASKILTGKSSAQCDVVNGGLDQLPYLLFTPPYTEAATLALEDYRRRLYPFTQREAQFRENVGPPPYIQFSKSVIANLDFIKRLSATKHSSSPSPTSKDSEVEQCSVTTPESGITDSSSVSQITRPLTSAESLRQQYSQRRHKSDSSGDQQSDDSSTAGSTVTSPSKLSDGRMSTSSAKLRELDVAIQRQKKTNEKQDAKNSERLSHIERKLHRIDDIDTKLDEVQTDFGQRLTIFESRMVETVKGHIESSHHNMENMNTSLEKLMLVVNRLLTHSGNPSNNSTLDPMSVSDPIDPSLDTGIVARPHTHHLDEEQVNCASHSNSSSSRSSMSSESLSAIQSPEHKRLKSGQKPSNDPVRRQLARAMEEANQPVSSPPTNSSQGSLDSLDEAMLQLEHIAQANKSNTASSVAENDNPDPESQYTASPPNQEDKDTNATPLIVGHRNHSSPNATSFRRQPIDPSIPLVPVSRLLSIPSTRPGRQPRHTSIDPAPSVSYGDPVIQKPTGSIRLFFQNVKGLTYTSTKEDYNYYLKCLQGLDVDIMGLSETNTCCQNHSNLGNLTSILGSLASRVDGSDILDATGLGRWSGVKLAGPDNKKLSIITAYRVCSGSPQTSPIGSSFLREYEFFREHNHPSPNPRRLFFVDLQKVILDLQESGYSTILMLDANSTLDDKQLTDVLARCGLQDLHSHDPPPSTFIGSAHRRIDFIFGCADARRHVIRSGSLAYTEGPQSDHRSLYVDLSPEFMTTPPWQSINSLQSRDLYTGNPEKVTTYHNAMLSYYAQHRMIERIQHLYDVRDSMDRDEIRSALIKWDNDQGRAMELGERTLRRPPQKCAWSPTLRNSAILRRYWLLRLREKLRDENYATTFCRWQMEIQTNDPAFRLPSLGQSLSIDQIRLSLNRANREFRRIQKQSVPLRLHTYQELLETYQEDTNPATKEESRRKAKIVQTTITGESIRHVFGNIRKIVRPSEQSGLSKVIVPQPLRPWI
ncbi:hypothetical protein MHU86_17355 [Fragilaria crotonensis]|nr:hypothetical protein MHU86_17355 [Fragilaria crotonensis]